LRRELADAYAALAVAEASATLGEVDGVQAEGKDFSSGSPGEISHLERKLEVQRNINTGLKLAVEARNGSAQCQAKQPESRELIAKVAKNSKTIAELKAQLQQSEAVERISVKRQESVSRSRVVAASPMPDQRSGAVTGSEAVATVDGKVHPVTTIPGRIAPALATRFSTQRGSSKEPPVPLSGHGADVPGMAHERLSPRIGQIR
jgi:hypothetical protein